MRLRVGAGIGHEQAVEARDAVPVWKGADPVLQLVEDVILGFGVDRVAARLHRTGAEVVGAGEIVAKLGHVGVMQGPMTDGRQVRRIPPFLDAPRRFADHLDAVAKVVPGEAVLEARLVSERQRHVVDVAAIAVARIASGQL